MRWSWAALAALALTAGAARAQGTGEAKPDAPAPTGLDARIAKLEAELAALKAAGEASAAEAAIAEDTKEPLFRLYGFIDMGFQKLWAVDDVTLPTTKSTFVLGNVNLYFDFHPAPDWSSLIEVRLTNYPAGDEVAGIPAYNQPYSRSDVTVRDPGNGIGYDTVRWGGIVLQRAYIQWQRTAKLGVRVGQFLTPYGIWNVDHGTPTLISLFLPKAQSNEMFPAQQLGVEVFGQLDHAPARDWRLEWHGYVSNGRTPGVVSLTESKMFGGRLVINTTRPVPMAFGVSAMHGTYVDQTHNADPDTGASVRPDVVHYNEWAVGVDASIDLGALRLRSEAALRHKKYRTGARDLWFPGVYVADGLETDIYGLAAYRIPHTPFEPYLYDEYYRWPTPVGDELFISSVGLNTYFTPAIQLKVQLSVVRFLDDAPWSTKYDSDETFLAAKLVMGF